MLVKSFGGFPTEAIATAPLGLGSVTPVPSLRIFGSFGIIMLMFLMNIFVGTQHHKYFGHTKILIMPCPKRAGKMTTGTHNNNAYIELLKTFPPRPIDSEEELLATQKVIDSLIDRGELTADELDYLNVLGSLVYEYEQLHHEPIPDICGVELIKALLVEYDLQPKDLVPIFKTESIRHLQKLSKPL